MNDDTCPCCRQNFLYFCDDGGNNIADIERGTGGESENAGDDDGGGDVEMTPGRDADIEPAASEEGGGDERSTSDALSIPSNARDGDSGTLSPPVADDDIERQQQQQEPRNSGNAEVTTEQQRHRVVDPSWILGLVSHRPQPQDHRQQQGAT